MDKPIIGLLGIRILDTSGPVPVVRDFINATYCESVARAGGIPVLVPATTRPEDVADALAVCQGLVLPGGLDVDPRLYGEDPLPVLGTVDVQVDELWAAALRCAMERGLPVLGICRGMQLANVALGGSLYQDVTLMRPDCQLHTQRQARDYPLHRVEVEKDSHLARILGTTSVFTNTMHHQCVREPGEGLRVVARTADGVPEAAETADGSIVLVQWHPEELLESVPCMAGLFTDLVDRAREASAR